MDGGEDGDDDDDNSSGDDADDEDEEDKEEEVEEEQLAPADSAIIIPTIELISPPEGTEPVIPPLSTNITTTGARITLRLQASISLPPEAEVEKLLAMPTPPPSPPILLSLPSAGERLTRIASTQALIDAVTTSLASPPLPLLLLSLYIPPPVDRRDDIPESEWPPRKRSCLFALGSRYKVRESSTARPTGSQRVDYRDTWEDPVEAIPKIAPMTLGEVNIKVTKLAKLHEHDTQDLYALLEDAQEGRTRISQRVTIDSQRVDLLMEDRVAHQETILIVEEEAYASSEAWAHAIGLNMRQEMSDMHAELLALQGQQRARQPAPDARVPDHQDASRDAIVILPPAALISRDGNGSGNFGDRTYHPHPRPHPYQGINLHPHPHPQWGSGIPTGIWGFFALIN
ncbi:hypothetical protein Tco_0025964 [Tanacetum coccineum]